MYQAPELPVPPVVIVFPEEAKGLWLKALEAPQADLRCKAADTIALAHRRGMKGLETTVAPLLAALDRPDQHPTVRLAVARALIAMEARGAAPSLWRHAQTDGADLRDLIEPALARWDYLPARDVWLERLRQPAGPRRNLVLAIEGLAAVREGQAADRLREMALSDRTDGPIRLEAARALGSLRDEGLEEDAALLLADGSPRGLVARLSAASLLRRHRGEKAVRLLQRLAEDREPAVAAVAVVRLLEIDPELLAPAAEHLLGNPEANIRSSAVEVLLRRPRENSIRLLGDRLDDAHPEVRGQARRALHELAGKKEFHDPVIAEATRMLATRQGRGLEQAAILLAQLDHKPAARRLVELLNFDRPETAVAVAWGLRRLDVPETVPDVAKYVEAELTRVLAARDLVDPEDPRLSPIDHQLSQLNQLLGQQKYAAGDAALRKFVPYSQKPLPEARAAAVWALGVIHEGKTDSTLAAALEERLTATQPRPPEDIRVRRMCAIALGRLRAKESLSSLKAACPNQQLSESVVGNACCWAIAQITGEAMLPPKTVRRVQGGWFLTPAE
jgi:HEAT repeat protein